MYSGKSMRKLKEFIHFIIIINEEYYFTHGSKGATIMHILNNVNIIEILSSNSQTGINIPIISRKTMSVIANLYSIILSNWWAIEGSSNWKFSSNLFSSLSRWRLGNDHVTYSVCKYILYFPWNFSRCRRGDEKTLGVFSCLNNNVQFNTFHWIIVILLRSIQVLLPQYCTFLCKNLLFSFLQVDSKFSLWFIDGSLLLFSSMSGGITICDSK